MIAKTVPLILTFAKLVIGLTSNSITLALKNAIKKMDSM